MKKRLSLLLTFIFVFIFSYPSYGSTILEIQTESVILIEAETGKILYEKNAFQQMFPASTTKILTTLLALELSDPEEIVSIGREVYTVPLDASKAGHLPGDEIVLKDLLMGLLLPSGNDSALSVATHIARKEKDDPNLPLDQAILYFADYANRRAKEMGAKNTHFVNPHGYHDDNHYTTAYDLGMITREAIKNQNFRKMAGTFTYTVDGQSGKQRAFSWRNRNLLLDTSNESTYYPYATGGKTGFTTPAGECLVATAQKDGVDLIAILLNSPKDERWGEAKLLFEYGFNNFKFHQVVKENEAVGQILVSKYKPKGPEEVTVIATEGFKDLFNVSDIPKIQQEIIWDEEKLDPGLKDETKLLAPIEEGQTLGSILYTLEGENLAKINIVASNSVEKRSIWDVIFSIQAIPFWLGTILGLFILRFILRLIKLRKRKNRGFRLR